MEVWVESEQGEGLQNNFPLFLLFHELHHFTSRISHFAQNKLIFQCTCLIIDIVSVFKQDL